MRPNEIVVRDLFWVASWAAVCSHKKTPAFPWNKHTDTKIK